MASDMRGDIEGETSGSSLGESAELDMVKYPPHQVSQIQVRKYLPGSFILPIHPSIHASITIKCLKYARL